MTNIILSGCNGRMGSVITSLVSERDDCKIVAGVDIDTHAISDYPIYNLVEKVSEKADVIIDFSHPSSLRSILGYAKTKNVPVVIATTGYSEAEIDLIKSAASSLSIFYSHNMSIGISLLCELAKKAATLLQDSFDIEIIEAHHNQKIDAPSGTALMLGDNIKAVLKGEYEYAYDRSPIREKRDAKSIGMHAIRGGTIVGEHDVIFAGCDEIVTLSHSARSKSVFAAGAVKAAIFMKNKPSGLYDMKNLVADLY